MKFYKEIVTKKIKSLVILVIFIIIPLILSTPLFKFNDDYSQENDTINDDDSAASYNAVIFLNGASIDRWELSGSDVTCSSHYAGGAQGFNLNCTQHASEPYTRTY